MKSKTKMKFLITHDSPASRDKSKYFETLQKEFIRMYGEAKGTRLANRYWDIRSSTDQTFCEERIKIARGLA